MPNKLHFSIAAVALFMGACCLLHGQDMALIYSGGFQRPTRDQQNLAHYVSYTDRSGNEKWLFDTFLFLEIFDRDSSDFCAQVCFDPGFKDLEGKYLQSATQADWTRVMNYHFAPDLCLDALDKAVGEAIARIGSPAIKRKVVLYIPNPMTFKNPIDRTGGTLYWGLLEDRPADFSKEEDQVAACRWYIDRCIRLFNEKGFMNIELEGFYWITETTYASRPLQTVANYVHSKGLHLCWIPHFQAKGYQNWKELGIDAAYYQPNYFFRESVPLERLDVACNQAFENGLSLEMEFDDRAVKSMGGTFAYRLRDYLKAFRAHRVRERVPSMAYYMGEDALVQLKESPDQEDRVLYQDFCDFVTGAR